MIQLRSGPPVLRKVFKAKDGVTERKSGLLDGDKYLNAQKTNFTCIPSKLCLVCNSKYLLNIPTALVVVRPNKWNFSYVQIYT